MVVNGGDWDKADGERVRNMEVGTPVQNQDGTFAKMDNKNSHNMANIRRLVGVLNYCSIAI